MKRRPGRFTATGLSLVELMVAMALGLIVVAAALRLHVTQIDSTRGLLLEARLHQDLRAAGELVSRDLRRAGHWPHALAALQDPSRPNPYAATSPTAGTPARELRYAYSRDAAENDRVDTNERFGLRLNAGALQALEGGTWQQLTDPGTLTITRFEIQPSQAEVPIGERCDPPCPSGDPRCPRLLMRQFDIRIGGRATGDATVRRDIRETVRVRNDDWAVAACPEATP